MLFTCSLNKQVKKQQVLGHLLSEVGFARLNCESKTKQRDSQLRGVFADRLCDEEESEEDGVSHQCIISDAQHKRKPAARSCFFCRSI